MNDCVVSLRLDPFRSGVARFNELLADRLGVPLVPLADDWERFERPLLSFKPAELTEDEAGEFSRRLDGGPPFDLFLHEWAGIDLERRLVGLAAVVWCGNAEIRAEVERLGGAAREAWAPGLLQEAHPFAPAEITVFSFGMAHKVRTDEFARLKELLEATGRSYALYTSHANHETATLEDARLVYEQLHAIFPRGLHFLGSLSDLAVYNQLVQADFFAAFFARGARSNNTTIASAMEHGAVVITNLDEYSPPALEHMQNVIDIDRCDALPTDPLVLRRISVNAIETARAQSWDRLVDTLRGEEA